MKTHRRIMLTIVSVLVLAGPSPASAQCAAHPDDHVDTVVVLAQLE